VPYTTLQAGILLLVLCTINGASAEKSQLLQKKSAVLSVAAKLLTPAEFKELLDVEDELETSSDDPFQLELESERELNLMQTLQARHDAGVPAQAEEEVDEFDNFSPEEYQSKMMIMQADANKAQEKQNEEIADRNLQIVAELNNEDLDTMENNVGFKATKDNSIRETVKAELAKNARFPCTAPDWNNATKYDEEDLVVYNGQLYQARFYTKGDNPIKTVGESWNFKEQCSCKRVPAWNPITEYTQSIQVTFQENIFEAKWWSRGTPPSSDYKHDGSWNKIGSC